MGEMFEINDPREPFSCQSCGSLDETVARRECRCWLCDACMPCFFRAVVKAVEEAPRG